MVNRNSKINILIIWDGENKLSKFRIDCVNQIKKIYSKDKLVCISKNNKILSGVVDEYIQWKNMEKQLWNKWFVKSQEVKVLSDYFRYFYLSETPYTLYLDTDVYIHKKIKKIEYIGKYGTDYSAIWNGNQCKFFEYIINLRKNNGHLSELLNFYPYDCKDLSQYMSHGNKN